MATLITIPILGDPSLEDSTHLAGNSLYIQTPGREILTSPLGKAQTKQTHTQKVEQSIDVTEVETNCLYSRQL